MSLQPTTTDPLHVCLGRHGDICIVLPALKRWADENGRPAALLTSKECAPMLDGCSYVKVVTMDATFHDLWPTLSFLKTDLPGQPVKNLQFYGSGSGPVLPSFWHEEMYLAGLLGGGESEPLVFDKRNRQREHDLCGALEDGRPMILVGLKGKSSPFKDAAALFDLIWHEFSDQYNVVDLSEVKAERIYDLLGLYDNAAALVSIDTVHLHLSRASQVPVFALARDDPERWHGTPQFERFAWYCRYGQVMEQAGELVEALKDTLDHRKKTKPKIIPTDHKGAYNPSVLRVGGHIMLSCRHHPNPRHWKTELMLDGLPVRFPYPVSRCAHEDMRLFTFQGKLHSSYVCSRLVSGKPRCIQGYGELVKADGFWAIRKHFQPALPGNDWSGLSKNAVYWDYDGTLCSTWNNGRVIEIQSEFVAHQWRSEPGTWPFGEIRGGTSPLPYKGKWLRFFHSRIWPDGRPWRYHLGVLVMEPEPPFATIAVSRKPIVSGDESGDPMIPHWKPNCVLPYGAVEQDGGWMVSLGINDAHCALLHVKETDLNL